MFTPDQYQLLDFGDGRKLERFAGVVLDRPCPAADRPRQDAGLWQQADARFLRKEEESGEWQQDGSLPETWMIQHAEVSMQLKPTPFGHVGLFAEQAANWDWIAQRVKRAGRPLRVLDLFAYTGGSTLAAASAGAEVTHVDAAKNVVAWARQNAELSNLADAPIRWIVEDALKFVEREVRRANTYDAVILDPPSYGRGPKGERWQLSQSLMPLLELCGKLTADHRAFLLLTCHTQGVGPAEAGAYLSDAVFGSCQAPPTAKQITISAASGSKLRSGVVVRWPAA
jgi:23S rRNA (cytosine1962-C5)-methyltransferase